jgi:hypothetical protein
MASWKKVIVSGSNISQLANDSNYITSAGTIDATASFSLVAGTSRNADSASVAARATELSAEATASFADLASNSRTATSASIAGEASTLSATATASFADLASVARTATSASIAATANSASVAARATELSADATASFADLAGTVHDGNITTAKIADSSVTNAKLQNDSITFGTTTQALGSTVTSISGLTSISSTTGSFVLQVFESSSTIITSGSNIFGDKADDIQQITGSLLQTGSAVISGSLDVYGGTISGSFVGDGSGLTGVASTLTVDGDSGTEDVNLTDDDLQILGTTDRITTAVTKVGTDVKVTLNLPDTVEVTASVATRANALAPTATASFALTAGTARSADSASVAARATTLSNLATASFALTAGTARSADSASVAARATTLSADATASFADLASDARTATSASYASKTDYGTSANTAVQGNVTLEVLGTANEITVTNGTAAALGSNRSITLALPDNVTIGSTLTVTGNTTIGGDLIVNGAIVSASSLEIADQFIILASGSNGAIDGGIIINQVDNHPDGKGKAFAYDSSANRWALQGDLNDTASVITPDAYMGVIQEGTFNAETAPLYGSTAGKGTIFVDAGGDIYIYG